MRRKHGARMGPAPHMELARKMAGGSSDAGAGYAPDGTTGVAIPNAALRKDKVMPRWVSQINPDAALGGPGPGAYATDKYTRDMRVARAGGAAGAANMERIKRQVQMGAGLN